MNEKMQEMEKKLQETVEDKMVRSQKLEDEIQKLKKDLDEEKITRKSQERSSEHIN